MSQKFETGDKVVIVGSGETGIIKDIYVLGDNPIALVQVGDSLRKILIDALMHDADIDHDVENNLADALISGNNDDAIRMVNEITITQDDFRSIACTVINEECGDLQYLSEMVGCIVAKIHTALFEDHSDDQSV